MNRHSLDCGCPPCLLSRVRLSGARLTLNDDGTVDAQWNGVARELRLGVKEHREAIVAILRQESEFARMAGDPRLGEALAICSRSSRPEAQQFADAVLNGPLGKEGLALGLKVADLIRYGDEELEGRWLDEAAKRVLLRGGGGEA